MEKDLRQQALKLILVGALLMIIAFFFAIASAGWL